MNLSAILNREFRNLEAEGRGPFPTVQSQAQYFGMEQTYLSKLRNEKQSLTRAKAQQMASKLRDGQSNAKIAELVAELLSAGNTSTPSDPEIVRWFYDLAKTEALMIVEFLEPPVVGPHGSRPDLAKIVGGAVSRGLHYAMLLPVNMGTITTQPHSIQTYFMDLVDSLDETYRRILEHALDEKIAELQDSQSQVNAEEAFEKVASCLRLYRLAKGDWNDCPSMGSRNFYTEQPELVNETSKGMGQLWNWVITSKSEHARHEILPKQDITPGFMRATTTKYSPILDYWRQHKQLAQNEAALHTFVNDFLPPSPQQKSGYHLIGRWEVQQPCPVLLRKALEKFNRPPK